jgi:adenylate cyclase
MPSAFLSQQRIAIGRPSIYANVMLAAAYAQVGRQQDTERQTATIRQRFPAFSSEESGSMMRDAGQRQKFALLFKKAGL